MRNIRLIIVLAVVYIDMLGIGLAYPILPRPSAWRQTVGGVVVMIALITVYGIGVATPPPSSSWRRAFRVRGCEAAA